MCHCSSDVHVFMCPQATMHYYRYESAEVSCCFKYLMFSYNIIFWVSTSTANHL